MNIEKLLKQFEDKPYMLEMGAGKLSKWMTKKLNVSISKEDIKAAKKAYRDIHNIKKSTKLPKILLLDIETAPIKGYVWRLWKQNIYLPQLISDWFMLTWSAKWLFDSTVDSDRLTGKEVLEENDYRIVKRLWSYLNEADIVIAHNGESFDIPKINARCIVNNLPPTSPYQQIDTKKIAAKQFGFSSNKLDGLAIQFGFKVKLDTDFELWAECMKGNEEALKYMEEYNKHDVELLEEVYLKLRPWIKAHPNVGLYIEADYPVCSNCGSNHLHKEGYYYTSTGRYETYRCECGAISRVRTTSYPKDKRKKLLVSAAK